MARRMNRNVHVRCRTGEKVEIISKPYLLLCKIMSDNMYDKRGFLKPEYAVLTESQKKQY